MGSRQELERKMGWRSRVVGVSNGDETGSRSSDLTADPVYVASMVSPSITAVGATKPAMPGFIGEEIQPLMVGDFSGGRSTRLRGPGKVVSSP